MLFGTMHLEKFFSAIGVKVFRAFSTIVKHCHCPILLTKEKFFLSRECGIETTL